MHSLSEPPQNENNHEYCYSYHSSPSVPLTNESLVSSQTNLSTIRPQFMGFLEHSLVKKGVGRVTFLVQEQRAMTQPLFKSDK